MFYAKFDSIKEFKAVIDATRELIDIANFKLSKKGLAFQAVDTSKTVLIDFFIGPNGFSALKSSEEILLGVNFQNLFKVFKCVLPTYSLEFSNADADRFVHLLFKDVSESKIARFNMSLLNKIEDNLDIPNSGYDSRVTMNSEEFARIIRDLNQISDDVQLTVDKKFFSFSVKSEFIEGTLIYKNSNSAKEDKLVKVNVTSKYSGVYSLKFLNDFCRAAPLSETVVLYFSANTPLVVDFPIGSYGSLRFFLASKMIADD